MANINLLTIHWGRSFGAVFQTFATCKLLENLGHNVCVINLLSPDFEQNKWKLSNLKYTFINYQFNRFKKHFFSQLTDKGCYIKDIKLPIADVTIVGSDQVWNRDITKENAISFFLDFVPDGQKRISLASSFGKAEWIEDVHFTQLVKQNLCKFSLITVRETSGKRLIEDNFNCCATQVADPTLLYGKFDDLIADKTPVNQIYPFLLNKTNEELLLAEELSNKLNVQLFKHTYYTAYIKNGPLNWLSRMYNSKYIVTDSFHGLAFSILFHKQFYVLCGNSRKFTRLLSLLELLNLQNRYIRDKEDMYTRWDILSESIDYSSIDSILDKERGKTLSFLRDIL